MFPLALSLLVTAPAQSPPPVVTAMPPLVRRVENLEGQVKDLSRRVDLLSSRSDSGVRVVPTPAEALPPPVVTYYQPPAPVQPVQYVRQTTTQVRSSFVTGAGHTHTCSRCGTSWDHGANASHNCPACGAAQYVQDTIPRTSSVQVQSVSPRSAFFGTSTGTRGVFRGRSGCANGNCGG